MHYELYVDSLFFINFIMNLYLLILVDCSTVRCAAPGRLAAGAAAGAFVFMLPFLGTAPVALKLIVGALIGSVGMLCITFPVKSFKMFLKLLERLILYSFGMGGAMLFVVRSLRPAQEILGSVFGILGVGGLGFLLFRRFKPVVKAENDLCSATLIKGEEEVTVTALVDSGNSLIEPISGNPVCVVERDVFERLWKGEMNGFRAIPYHSIGKKKGIMPGYPLPELQLKIDGIVFTFHNVYIAVSEEEISAAEGAGAGSVKMIVNPKLLEGGKGKPQKRQNERHNDTESDDTGQDAV